mmetsp:Transcript_108479/g.258947  ORF Transcript_108479/g.258947 Transcript_108479/m.258947 type:complete len:234 (-) Transcript_108479:17-718(-)
MRLLRARCTVGRMAKCEEKEKRFTSFSASLRPSEPWARGTASALEKVLFRPKPELPRARATGPMPGERFTFSSSSSSSFRVAFWLFASSVRKAARLARTRWKSDTLGERLLEVRFSSPVSGCPDPEPGFTGASSSEDSEFESESWGVATRFGMRGGIMFSAWTRPSLHAETRLRRLSRAAMGSAPRSPRSASPSELAGRAAAMASLSAPAARSWESAVAGSSPKDRERETGWG